MLLSCSNDSVPPYPAQTWEDVKIEVETRPTLAEKGMNEFLVIASRPPRKPAHDLIISLRIDEDDRWHQAIQDGHVGVYRRTVLVADPAKDILSVRIQHDNREGVLYFPLAR